MSCIKIIQIFGLSNEIWKYTLMITMLEKQIYRTRKYSKIGHLDKPHLEFQSIERQYHCEDSFVEEIAVIKIF
jgi:hypothetical protein